MSKVKFKHDKNGYFELMNSSAMQGILSEYGASVQNTANDMGSGDYDLEVGTGKTRAHAYVKASDLIAVRSNYKHNTLLKALGSSK